jgi:hypothetical protein
MGNSQRSDTPDWILDARLATFLCRKLLWPNPRKWKSKSNQVESSEDLWLKKGSFGCDEDDDDDDYDDDEAVVLYQMGVRG